MLHFSHVLYFSLYVEKSQPVSLIITLRLLVLAAQTICLCKPEKKPSSFFFCIRFQQHACSRPSEFPPFLSFTIIGCIKVSYYSADGIRTASHSEMPLQGSGQKPPPPLLRMICLNIRLPELVPNSYGARAGVQLWHVTRISWCRTKASDRFYLRRNRKNMKYGANGLKMESNGGKKNGIWILREINIAL